MIKEECASPPGVSVTVAILGDCLDKLLLNQRSNYFCDSLADDRSRVFSVVRSFIT